MKSFHFIVKCMGNKLCNQLEQGVRITADFTLSHRSMVEDKLTQVIKIKNLK